MSGTEVRPDIDLEELLDNEIPCGGWQGPLTLGVPCGRSAELRSDVHGCIGHYSYLCIITCWKNLYVHLAITIGRGRRIQCLKCCDDFYTPESFSDYRPF